MRQTRVSREYRDRVRKGHDMEQRGDVHERRGVNASHTPWESAEGMDTARMAVPDTRDLDEYGNLRTSGDDTDPGVEGEMGSTEAHAAGGTKGHLRPCPVRLILRGSSLALAMEKGQYSCQLPDEGFLLQVTVQGLSLGALPWLWE